MTGLLKKIETLANLAIIIVATLLAAVLIKGYLWPYSPSQNDSRITTASPQQIKIGEKINLTEVDWQKNRQTLLLVLSTTCHFCSESAPFYQQLVKERDVNTRIIAVLPQPASEGKDYLNKLGVSVDDIKQVSLSSIGIRGTPTLLLVDNSGVVKDSWVGKLSISEESKVLNQVRQSVAQE